MRKLQAGFLDGRIAQEENMFRRTDCMFTLFKSEELWTADPRANPPKNEHLLWKETHGVVIRFKYSEEHTNLLKESPEGKNQGSGFFDGIPPCLLCWERKTLCKIDESYRILPEDEVFEFKELECS